MSSGSESSDSVGPAAAPAPKPGSSRLGLLLAAFGLLLVVYFVWKPGGDDRGSAHPAVGERLPWTDLQPLVHADSPLTADQVAGRVTLVNFWGPWCPPCREEFPKLMQLREQLPDESRFRLVSVACAGSDDEPREVLQTNTREYLDWLEARPPVFEDPKARFRVGLMRAARLADFAYPTTVLLDGRGVIRGVWVGYYEGEEAKVRAAIERLLSEESAS